MNLPILTSIFENQWVTVAITAVITGAVSAIIAAIVQWIKNKHKKLSETKQDERKSELKELFDEFSTPIITKLDNVETKLDNVSEGTKNSLRNDLLKYYYDCLKKGYRSEKDTHNFEGMYASYIALGGNSFIKDEIYPKFHEEISFLTEKEIYELEHKSRSEKDELNKKLNQVIERSMNCPHFDNNTEKSIKCQKTKKSKGE